MGKIFSKNYTTLIFCLIFSLFIFADISSTDAAFQEDELFEKAYNYYLSYKPEKAIELFDMFLQKYPASSSKDAALFWKARSLVQINKKDEAVHIFRVIIEEFPSSHFKNFAELELENINRTDMSVTVTSPAFNSREIAISHDKLPDNNPKAEKAIANDLKQKAQLDEYQKKLQLSGKAVLKAIEEKNICLESLEGEKRKIEDLSKKANSLSDLITENQKLKEGLKLKEDQKLLPSEASISETVEEKNNCLESLKEERRKTEDLSQKTKSLFNVIKENQRLKVELKLKEEQKQIEDQKQKEYLKIIEDHRSLKSNLNECNIKMKVFFEENLKNKKALTEVLKEREGLAEDLKSSTDNEKELQDRLLGMQKKQKSQEDTADIGTVINRDKAGLENNIDNLQAEVAVLSEKLKQYEVPIFKIVGKQYTAAQVIDEYLTASDVENKLRQKTISWKKGNAYENFFMEQILLNKAQELKIQGDVALYNMLIKQYSFSEKEKAYLARYLTINKLISKISGNIYIQEPDIRKYYEKNKHEFLVSPGEEVINVLSIDYTAENELERNLLTIDIQNKAANGYSLDKIQDKQPDIISLKQYSSSLSPDWIKEEAGKLKEGEISNIISKDNKYIIIQPLKSIPIHEKYEDVHYVIRENLLEKIWSDSQVLNNWLKEIQNTDGKTASPSNTNIALQSDKKTDKPKSKSVVLKKKRALKPKKTVSKKTILRKKN